MRLFHARAAVVVGALLAWAVPTPARADPHTYALVIGANHGGYGQAPLRFATQDAKHFAELLVELGRTPADHVQLLLEPTPTAIEQAIAQLHLKLGEHARAGERSKLLFYYSGHARARALSLAGGELPLEALREALLSLPSTLTVAVLDACQSGAFSGVKGARPAVDFSSGAISDLRNEGVAVMASSTAAELSQESLELGASYFTHHLVTGLRGAADGDTDGTVSLDEAYRYAYHNTLSDTLRTRVGSQHATLEMELKGHGSVPLTYTVDADAQLRLPDNLTGRVVVQRGARGAVLAELEKAPGAALMLALPHGEYEVLVRQRSLAPISCAVTLIRRAQHELKTRGCPTVNLPSLAAKGGSAPFERWFAEFAISRHFTRTDGYVRTLETFRFHDTDSQDGGSYTPEFLGGFGFTRHFSVLGRLERLQSRSFERQFDVGTFLPETTSFDWATWSLMAGARGRLPLFAERFVPFLELDAGFGLTRSTYVDPDDQETTDRDLGPVLVARLGFTAKLFWRIGLIASGGYGYAPVLKNRIGDRHDDGGFDVSLGLRIRGLTGGS